MPHLLKHPVMGVAIIGGAAYMARRDAHRRHQVELERPSRGDAPPPAQALDAPAQPMTASRLPQS